MADPKPPVPLDEIEATHAWDQLDADHPMCWGCANPVPCPTAVLCGALRIAVEGLEDVDPACMTQRWDDDEQVIVGDRCGTCLGCKTAERLAAVRELVDLGEKP